MTLLDPPVGAQATSKGDQLVAGLVFALALPLLVYRMYYPSEWGDEGYFANGALRVLSGEVIYRDFQHNYPPGRIYTIALLIALFGQDLLVVRSLWVFFHAASIALSFLVARRLVSTPAALLVAFVVLFNTAHLNKGAELFLASFILLILFRAIEGRTSPLGAGAGMAFAGLYRHDVAVFGTIVYAVALGVQALQSTAEGTGFSKRYLERLREAWKFVLGFALVLGPVCLYLLSNGALIRAIGDLAFSGFIANKVLSREFPALITDWTVSGIVDGLTSHSVVYYIPIAIFIVSVGVAIVRLVKRPGRLDGLYVLIVALLGATLFSQVILRTDPGHLNKAYVPAHILGIFLMAAAIARLVWHARANRYGSVALWIAPVILAVTMPAVQFFVFNVHERYSARYAIPSVIRHRNMYRTHDLPKGWSTVPLTWSRYYERLFAEIEPYAGAEGEWMVVFPAGAIFNFLFDVPSPIRFDLLRPGELAGEMGGRLEANHPEVLREVMARLEETKPRFLLESAENTNEQVRGLIEGFAERHDYRMLTPETTQMLPNAGVRLVLYIRPD